MTYYTSPTYSSTSYGTATDSWGCTTTASTTTADYYCQGGTSWYTIKVGSYEETEEQKRERLRREEEQRQLAARQEAERKAAVEKAEELLKQHIGLENYGALYKTGYLELDSQKYQGHKYRIYKDANKQIYVLDKEGKIIDRLCIVFKDTFCPDGDKLVMKYALATMAEEKLLETANHFR